MADVNFDYLYCQDFMILLEEPEWDSALERMYQRLQGLGCAQNAAADTLAVITAIRDLREKRRRLDEQADAVSQRFNLAALSLSSTGYYAGLTSVWRSVCKRDDLKISDQDMLETVEAYEKVCSSIAGEDPDRAEQSGYEPTTAYSAERTALKEQLEQHLASNDLSAALVCAMNLAECTIREAGNAAVLKYIAALDGTAGDHSDAANRSFSDAQHSFRRAIQDIAGLGAKPT